MRLLTLEDGGWKAADLSSYKNEEELEVLLASDTSLLPGGKGSAAVRQFSLAGGAVDLVCIDEYGTITVVECKLQTNRESRRQVVGQIFAYAAALAELETDDVIAKFESKLKPNESIATAITASAGHVVTLSQIRENLGANLVSGAVRLVIAVDGVVDELRSVIEYLSKHLPDEVQIVALEVGQFVQDNVRLLAVDSFGHELENVASTNKAGPRRKWTWDEIDGAAKALPEDQQSVLGRLQKHMSKYSAVFNGGTGPDPSGGFYYQIAGKRRSMWSLWMVPGKAQMSVNIGSVNNASPDAAQSLIATLSESPYFSDRFATLSAPESRYPTVMLQDLVDNPDALMKVLQAFDEAIASKVSIAPMDGDS